MLKNIILHSKSAFLFAVLITGLLTSCEGDAVDHSTYIPVNSCAVMSVNTDQIFSDAMFDLISNTDLTEGVVNGPLAGLVEDPGNAGLVRFDRYYLFATGENVMESRLGVILPLSDHEKLSSYLTTNLKIEIT